MDDRDPLLVFVAFVALISGFAGGGCLGQRSGRDAMCAATCADAADWSRTGTDCTCLDPVERSARRSPR